MNDFLRELQEDIERQKWLALWERFGRFIIGSVVAVLVVAGGVKLWQAYDRAQDEKATDALLAAMDAPAKENLAKAAQDMSGNHAAIAGLSQASALADSDPAKAQALYAEVTASGADKAFVSLSESLSGDGKPHKKDAFYFSELERQGWNAVADKDYAAARGHFTAVMQDDKTPAPLKARAGKALSWLASQNVPGAE